MEFKYLKELFDFNDEQILEIVKLSIESINGGLSDLKEALETKDKKKVFGAFHIIKPNLSHLDLMFIIDMIPDEEGQNFWNELAEIILIINKNLSDIKQKIS